MSRNFHSLGRVFGVALLAMLSLVVATPARATQDIVEFGSKIEVQPNEAIHDAVCFFCSVDVDGAVNGDIVVFFGNVRIAGKANHDVVNFFGDVTAADNATIGHDLVNFFGGVRLGQNVTVGQDTVVMFGSLHATQPASFMIGGSRVVEPAWLFWGPFMALGLGIYFVVHEFRGYRRRRVLGMYRL